MPKGARIRCIDSDHHSLMKTPGLGSKRLCFGPLSVPKKRLAGVVSREIISYIYRYMYHSNSSMS